ncbi:MAG: aminotransferase class I/II-fold pyridoxal phosphate-dependent enzyme [Sterolibacterium sp.]|jgi:aspartate/methionine/tyrosine aminotransferase
MFKLLGIAQQMEREGQRILHFEIGDPNFESPRVAVEAASLALESGQNHYTNSMGLQELRTAIAEYTHSDLGFRPDLQQVLVCPANAIIDFCVRCIANPGDEVLVPNPGFATYFSVLDYNSIVPVGVPLREANDFKMKPEDVSQRITGKTKLIILNSPQNPTGSVMDEQDVLEIARIAEEYDLYILSDEVYSKLIYDRTHYSPSVVDRCRDRTILLKSFSKTYAMPGWRVGYAVGPVQVIEKMGLLLQTILSCLPAFVQMGAMAALGDKHFAATCAAELKARRDSFVDGLNRIRGVHCVKPDGAFYLFPRVDHAGMTGFEYSEKILMEEGLCILPGSSFGDWGSGYMRLSYSNVTLPMIGEALEKMERFHNRHF